MSACNEWKKVTISVIAAAFFTALCVVSITMIDGMSGGFALAFVSFFLAVSSAAVSLLFVYRARVMDAILADPAPLARWTYPEEIAHASVEREYHEYQERNQAMFIIIGGMLVVFALFFLIFVGEGGLETGLFLLIVAAFLYGVSRVTPWLERRRATCAPHEAVITREGIVYEGSVYPFRSFMVFRNGVTLKKPGKRNPAALVFSFNQLTGGYIVQPFDVVVPVPAGEEERARQVVRHFCGDASE
jgi:hypothetical protein